MRYASIREGKSAPGLRLVLTAGVPGPWGESAKAIFRLKGLEFLALKQDGGGENTELMQWTGQASAPVAVWGEEKPVTDSLDILFLAERLAPTPVLIPHSVSDRVTMFGLAREIIGRRGLGWERRTMMLGPMSRGEDVPDGTRRLMQRYDFRPEETPEAAERCARILRHLVSVLKAQRARGFRYLVGECLSAVDIYWACFSIMLFPLPEADCPMPRWLSASYATTGETVSAALDQALIEHRDFIFAEHIGLPMDFLEE